MYKIIFKIKNDVKFEFVCWLTWGQHTFGNSNNTTLYRRQRTRLK